MGTAIRYFFTVDGESLSLSDVKDPTQVFAVESLDQLREALAWYTTAGYNPYWIREVQSKPSGPYPPIGDPVLTVWKTGRPLRDTHQSDAEFAGMVKHWWFTNLHENTDPHPDFRVFLGPRGGIVMEAC